MATREDKSAKVLELERQHKGLTRELTDNKQIVDDMVKRQRALTGELSNIENQIRQLRNSMPENIEVTNHAILRFAQRRYGLDVEGMKREITDLVKGAELGLNEIRFNGFVIKNNAVITYLPTAVDLARDPTLSETP